jgi:hypothetical protein
MFTIGSAVQHGPASGTGARNWRGLGMPDDQNWRRRQAIQIAAQLPEKTDDALAVLELTKELVVGFLCADQPRTPLAAAGVAEVVAFPASVSSR